MESRRRRRWPVLRAIIATLLAVWVSSVLAVLGWGMRDNARPSDAIVVLGAAQYAGRPSPVLKARLDHAVALWQKGYAKWFILTGGTGKGDTTSEAAVGRRYVLRQGVPDDAILLEREGRSTDVSMSGVAALMREHDMHHAILVSDPFHMLRLLVLARHYGIDAAMSPTRTSPISANRSQAVAYILGESVKVPLTVVYALARR